MGGMPVDDKSDGGLDDLYLTADETTMGGEREYPTRRGCEGQ